jgi:hypothetical protein
MMEATGDKGKGRRNIKKNEKAGSFCRPNAASGRERERKGNLGQGEFARMNGKDFARVEK